MTEIAKKKAVVIAIGDEILIGQILDTNSNWLATEMHSMGIDLFKVVVVGDNKQEILKAVEDAEKQARLIVCTGGIGPTRDDRTKEVLSEYFGFPMEYDDEVYSWIADHKRKQGKEPNELHRRQAFVPKGIQLFKNFKGTAPGMLGEKNGTIVISVPGVPYEMKALMREKIFPALKQKIDLKITKTKTLLTVGVPESEIAGMLEKFEDELPKGVSLAYLPGHTRVRLRLTIAADDEARVDRVLDKYVGKIYAILGSKIYGEGEDTLEEVTGKMLREKGLSLSTAESCTGGFISHLITSVPGSSNYFKGGVVAYSNEIKIAHLDVPPDIIKQFGAVSEQTVRHMVKGVCHKMNTDLGIAVSGIAGPGGGSEEKPVGTVWIAVGGVDNQRVEKLQLQLDRKLNIEKSGLLALNMLRLFLSGD